MTRIGVSWARLHWPQLIERINNGETFTLTQNHNPIATITPTTPQPGAEPIEAPIVTHLRNYAEQLTASANALARAGYTTEEQVMAASDVDLLDVRAIGPGRLDMIRAVTTPRNPT